MSSEAGDAIAEASSAHRKPISEDARQKDLLSRFIAVLPGPEELGGVVGLQKLWEANRAIRILLVYRIRTHWA